MYVDAKMIPVKLFQELGKRSIKESSGGCEFKCDIRDTL
jgi:hypothetical protein